MNWNDAPNFCGCDSIKRSILSDISVIANDKSRDGFYMVWHLQIFIHLWMYKEVDLKREHISFVTLSFMRSCDHQTTYDELFDDCMNAWNSMLQQRYVLSLKVYLCVFYSA